MLILKVYRSTIGDAWQVPVRETVTLVSRKVSRSRQHTHAHGRDEAAHDHPYADEDGKHLHSHGS